MFFPLKDTIPTRRFPVINSVLIGSCTLLFLYQAILPEDRLDLFIDRFGMAPAQLFGAGNGSVPGRLAPLVTCMFLHGGWLHLLGNMLYLYIFGDNVEDRLGHVRFVFFYLGCGMAGSLLQALLDPSSEIHTIGASGAIAGVLGSYLIFYPRARVVAVVFIFILIQAVEVPAYLFLGFWFVLQLFQGVGSLGAMDGGGVAWWAHIGGFLAGALTSWWVRRREIPASGRKIRFPL